MKENSILCMSTYVLEEKFISQQCEYMKATELVAKTTK